MVRNATEVDVKIQEGNAGVFVTRSVVKNDGTYKLVLDPDATYVLIIMPGDNTALKPAFSSDDVAEFKEILIKKEDSEYVWEGISATTPASANIPEACPKPPGAPPTCFFSIGGSLISIG